MVSEEVSVEPRRRSGPPSFSPADGGLSRAPQRTPPPISHARRSVGCCAGRTGRCLFRSCSSLCSIRVARAAALLRPPLERLFGEARASGVWGVARGAGRGVCVFCGVGRGAERWCGFWDAAQRSARARPPHPPSTHADAGALCAAHKSVALSGTVWAW